MTPRLLRRLGFVVLLVVLVGCSSSTSHVASVATLPGYQSIPGRPFGPATQTVTQVGGGRWSFKDTPAGTITLLYFGYTSCPDVCPTTMADLAYTMKDLPADVRDKIQVRFVSTDPQRDTPDQIRGWLDGFSPAFIGERAPIGTVIAAARVYGVGIEAPKVTNGDYQVTHGAEVLVLEPGGRAVGFFDKLAGWHDYIKGLPVLVSKYT